ncbi:hypothetical protein BUALT_Bualt13G0095900 [Buddleja alternifolia]|uniref:Uncharacterized protein n=1 Tax=Buddleja alternifolia TaxID=168488 RepID=A0AAV6WLW3_9LAMI|nr:hypothetical protein BUALT_Bualt13G0095900 [Buddleja alternifolia]
MSNPISVIQQISLFRSRIQNRSFDDGTVAILQLILVSKDVESLVGVRSALKDFMRDESLLIFREIVAESVEIKLLCTDFLIRVFAVIGDVEAYCLFDKMLSIMDVWTKSLVVACAVLKLDFWQSCLALRYEALVMRQQKTTSYPELEVSYKEWLTFAEHSLENGFHSIADKACGKALTCSYINHAADSEISDFFHDVDVIKKIKILKCAALLSMSSRSVQAQATVYLKRKEVAQSTYHLATSIETQSCGSSRFRSGIRKRNLRRLHDYQCL